jgi:hypothetical protein
LRAGFVCGAQGLIYNRPMATPDLPTDDAPTFDPRPLVKAALITCGLLLIAAGLLWWRFGAIIFMDMLTFAQSCFF